MAYSGWLVKVGNYTIPANKYIKAESYSAYANMQDIDPWTDANGFVHREAVDLKAIKVEFETPAMLTNKQFEDDLIANIRKQFVKEVGKECYITAYIPELNKYVTQYGYMADFTPQMYQVIGNTIKYDSVRIAFIGGVYHA